MGGQSIKSLPALVGCSEEGAQVGLLVLVTAHLPPPSSAQGLCALTEGQGVLLWPSSRLRRGRGSTPSPICRVPKPS